MIVNWKGEMNDEMLADVVEFVNTVDKKTNIDLYFCTNGGYTYVAEIMSRLLSPYKNLKIFLYDDVSSSGLYFTLKLGAPIEIVDMFLTCVIHLPYMEVSTSVNGKVRNKNQMMVKADEIPWVDLISSYLTTEQMERVIEGEDVFLTYSDLKQIYEKANSKKGRKV